MVNRTIELLKAAAAAEALRLRAIFHRQRLRAVYGIAAVIFAIATLVLLHVVLHEVAALWLTTIQSDLVVLVFDLAIAGIAALLGLRDSPDTIEVQALEVRQRAVAELKQVRTLAFGAVGLLLPRRLRSRTPSRAGAFGNLTDVVLKRLISKS